MSDQPQQPSQPGSGHPRSWSGQEGRTSPPPMGQQHSTPREPYRGEQPQQHSVQTQAPQNGLGVAALILGIVALALAWIPLINYLAFILGVLGIALAVLAFVKVSRGTANNGVVAAIGLALSIIAIVAGVTVMSAFFSGM